MEGFAKIPNTVFELGLTPSQFTVLCNLIRVQSYREYKGEVKDGWFAKSQNELAKECGFKSRKTLTNVLNTMVKNTIVKYTIDKTDVTKFKITIAENTIVKNTIDTMVNNTTPAMVNFTTLHNNSNKNNKQDIIKDTSTRDIITNPDNFNQNKEVNKQNVVIEEKEDIKETNVNKEEITPVTINGVESIPVFPDNFKSKRMDKLLEEFKSSEDNTKHPTKEQLLCMTYLENLSFSKADFKSILDKPKNNGYYIPSSWFELMCCSLPKLKPIATKYNFKSIGIPDCEVYQEMIGSYLEKNIDYFKIKIPSK